MEITIPKARLNGRRSVKFSWRDARGERVSGLVARHEGVWYAYRNVCPHLGTPLDWDDARFFEEEGRYLVCATHGALFQPYDGHCVAGPCSGDKLLPLALEENGEGDVTITIAPLAEDEEPVGGLVDED